MEQTRKFLNKNKTILILNADKGNVTVAMEKKEYDDKMRIILSDPSMYKILKRDPTTTLQKKNNAFVESLYEKKLITVKEKLQIKTNTATAPRIYGLPKVHKPDTPLRPICAAINSPSYELCRFIINILKNLTRDSIYNSKDASEFKKRINNTYIYDDENMISFDVVSLFPSIPVDFALRIIENKWSKIEEFTNIPKKLFIDMLKFCIKDNRYFKHDGKIFAQQKGLPMGSPASPIIADIVMEELLDTCLEHLDTKPRLLTKYVDDIFAIVKTNVIDQTLEKLNSFHRNIKFTMEEENNGRLTYLDTVLIRRGNFIKMDWHQKPTASGRLINFTSKHPRSMIINTAKNFMRRVMTISDKTFHTDSIKKVINILQKNSFPIKIIKRLITEYKTKTKGKETREPKQFKSVTYIPGFSERFAASNMYDKEKIKIAHKMNNTLRQYYSNTKEKLEKLEKANVIYKIPCNGDGSNTCQKVYVGTTKSKLKTRISSHKSDHKTRRPVDQKTALAAHCSDLNHAPNFDKVEILQHETNYSKRYMLEMLHIVNTPTQQRLNYKTDTDNCAHIYRHLIKLNSKKH